MEKLMSGVMIYSEEDILNSNVKIQDVIDNDIAYEELIDIQTQVKSLEDTLKVAEETALGIEERISLEQSVLDSNVDITSGTVQLSVIGNEALFNQVGYEYDHESILSNEDHREALTASMEVKMLGLKDILSMFKNVYDKFINLIKKLYAKAIALLSNVKCNADKLKAFVNENRSKSDNNIPLDESLEKQLIAKFGAALYGFSNGSIDSKFVKNYLDDITDTKTMIQHKEQLVNIVNGYKDFFYAFSAEHEGKSYRDIVPDSVIENLNKASKMDEKLMSQPFKYSGTKYKFLTVEELNIPKGANFNDVFRYAAGVRILVESKEINVDEIKGKFKTVKYDDLSPMLDLVSKDTKEIKSVQQDISKAADEVLKTIKSMTFGEGEEGGKRVQLILPVTRYANTILSTVAVDKMIGYVNGLKDVLKLVNILVKAAVKEGGVPAPVEGQLALPNKTEGK